MDHSWSIVSVMAPSDMFFHDISTVMLVGTEGAVKFKDHPKFGGLLHDVGVSV